MALNTLPIFGKEADIQWSNVDGDGGATGPLLTANTAKDGTGTVLTVYTAPTNGGFVNYIRIKSAGSNDPTVLRLFINNGSTNATASNNIFFDEIGIPSQTAQNSSRSFFDLTIPWNIGLPGGYKILATIGTTIAAGIFIGVVGRKT